MLPSERKHILYRGRNFILPKTGGQEHCDLFGHLQCQEHYQWNNSGTYELTTWVLSLVD